MTTRPKNLKSVVTAVTIAVAALGIAPSLAEAQSRGIMQVSAQVVSMDESVAALSAARTAVARVARPADVRRPETAPTVARVSVARDPRAIVVTIDYSRS